MFGAASVLGNRYTDAACTLLAGPWRNDPVMFVGDYFTPQRRDAPSTSRCTITVTRRTRRGTSSLTATKARSAPELKGAVEVLIELFGKQEGRE